MLLFVNMQLINIIIRQSMRIRRVMAEGYEAGAVKALKSVDGANLYITLFILYNTLSIITGKAVFYSVVCKCI